MLLLERAKYNVMYMYRSAKALKRDFIYNMIYSSRKKGLRRYKIFDKHRLAQFSVLHQYFVVERHKGHYLEVVVHL